MSSVRLIRVIVKNQSIKVTVDLYSIYLLQFSVVYSWSQETAQHCIHRQLGTALSTQFTRPAGIAGPTVWNSLPEKLKKKLKTLYGSH